MAVLVEHGKRRYQILEKALDVFIEEGFESTTCQKIADTCGITRPTLYQYFRNKREIFTYSIKLLLAKLEESIQCILADRALGSVEKIIKIFHNIFKQFEENRRLLSVILDYLLHLSKNNADPGQRVRRRTIRMRHILASLVIDGVKKGELKPVSVKTADDFLYSFIEGAIFRLVVLQRETVGDLRDTVAFAARQFAS